MSTSGGPEEITVAHIAPSYNPKMSKVMAAVKIIAFGIVVESWIE